MEFLILNILNIIAWEWLLFYFFFFEILGVKPSLTKFQQLNFQGSVFRPFMLGNRPLRLQKYAGQYFTKRISSKASDIKHIPGWAAAPRTTIRTVRVGNDNPLAIDPWSRSLRETFRVGENWSIIQRTENTRPRFCRKSLANTL